MPSDAPKSMDDLVALCKRRGFIYQASEIYGGINGFWDYGPLGVQLKKNLADAWWCAMTLTPPPGPGGRRLQIVGVDSAIIQNSRVWEASGHLAGFSDPMQTCRQCKKLFRADHVPELLEEAPWVSGLRRTWEIGDALVVDILSGWVKHIGIKQAKGMALVRNFKSVTDNLLRLADASGTRHAIADMSFDEYLRRLATDDASGEIAGVCPNCGGDLTEPRQFNLMFETRIGAVADEDNKAYLRPETAQGIFINFKNVLDTTRVRVPFGIAQVGKAFRNEVTPRNFIFRCREFEQMEMEWFCHPSEAQEWMDFWIDQRLNWWKAVGLKGANLILRKHETDELAHYAKTGVGTVDIEYKWPFTDPGYGELEGIAHRTDYDLVQHAKASGAKFEYFDQERNERYMPHVIEPAAGLTRGILALLCEAFTPDESRPSKVFMKFDPRMAPIKAAVYPLVNKDGMPETAERLHAELVARFGRQGTIEYDPKQNIGKRYARMDEAGCPFCFTIDSQTLTDQTVTVRHRDTQAQERIGLDAVAAWLGDRL